MGIVFFGVAALVHDPVFIVIFLLWISCTRTVHSALTGLIAKRWHPIFPALTYYGQIVGAGIKIFVNHNPNVQKWTRQNTGGAAVDRAALVRGDSKLMLTASIIAFAAGIIALTNVTTRSDRFDFAADTAAAELIYGR